MPKKVTLEAAEARADCYRKVIEFLLEDYVDDPEQESQRRFCIKQIERLANYWSEIASRKQMMMIDS